MYIQLAKSSWLKPTNGLIEAIPELLPILKGLLVPDPPDPPLPEDPEQAAAVRAMTTGTMIITTKRRCALMIPPIG
jgi:hypothetical protein